ncbi:hypothetical protein HZS_5174 [Henneguya salminicola]|nr:hypothetical protein HZS_5174 [Henneguya salminicola]
MGISENSSFFLPMPNYYGAEARINSSMNPSNARLNENLVNECSPNLYSFLNIISRESIFYDKMR